ncbi:unnamed protein product [Prunus brigantina]
MMTLRPNQKENDDHREMTEEVQRSLLFVSKPKACTEQEEMEQDSGGSSEEMESPRSVGRWRRRAKRAGCVHSQILRIREEDAHLGESTSFGAKDNHRKVAHAVASGMDVVLFARPILPCSPLKNSVNAFH